MAHIQCGFFGIVFSSFLIRILRTHFSSYSYTHTHTPKKKKINNKLILKMLRIIFCKGNLSITFYQLRFKQMKPDVSSYKKHEFNHAKEFYIQAIFFPRSPSNVKQQTYFINKLTHDLNASSVFFFLVALLNFEIN